MSLREGVCVVASVAMSWGCSDRPGAREGDPVAAFDSSSSSVPVLLLPLVLKSDHLRLHIPS